MDDPRDDPATPSITQYEVVNENDFLIADFFDGIPISFPPGETVTVSPDVCLHCFGYPGEARDMALHMARRYGWASKEMLAVAAGPGRTEPRYVALAANIKINPVYFDIIRRDRNAPIPADPGGEAEMDRDPGPTGDATKTGKGTKSRRRTPARMGGADAPRGGKPRARAR